MSSRGDFLRGILFGIVIGVAVTTAFFQLRGPSCLALPAPTNSSAVAVDAAP